MCPMVQPTIGYPCCHDGGQSGARIPRPTIEDCDGVGHPRGGMAGADESCPRPIRGARIRKWLQGSARLVCPDVETPSLENNAREAEAEGVCVFSCGHGVAPLGIILQLASAIQILAV